MNKAAKSRGPIIGKSYWGTLESFFKSRVQHCNIFTPMYALFTRQRE